MIYLKQQCNGNSFTIKLISKPTAMYHATYTINGETEQAVLLAVEVPQVLASLKQLLRDVTK